VQTSQALFSCGFGKGELAGKRSFFMSKTVSKFALTAGFALAMAFTFSCSSDDEGGGGGGKGNDIKNYKTIVIGTQTWMAENLNYAVDGSKCYDNDPANCKKYGRLFTWSTAMSVCPSGWHLPSDVEWDVLVTFAGGSSTAGTKLKAASGWDRNGNGTDDYGFSALPGGGGNSSGGFFYVGRFGDWWSSATEKNSSYAYYRSMYNDSDVSRYQAPESHLYSVRCVQD
jgi:uncharacterized protein (TIGR02145 family)